MKNNIELYKKMVLIREFETKILDLFSEGLLVGTTHTYIGQEAVGVGVVSALADDDIIFSNHRCHGHFLAYCGNADTLLAEIMGKEGGVVGGRGGSQHIHYKNFYSNGIQGGIVPNAAGMALAEKIKNSGVISLAFLGDGTLGQGVVYETMNIVSLWNIPILFVVENNRYAQTTPFEMAVSGKIANRPNAFDIECVETDSYDVAEIYEIAGGLINSVRTASRPVMLVCNTYRFGPHSKGDDFRSEEEKEQYKKKDPILFFESKYGLSEFEIKKYNLEANNRVKKALEYANQSNEPTNVE